MIKKVEIMSTSKVVVNSEDETIEVMTEKKIKDGKLLKLTMVVDHDSIDNIEISGDFFINPETFIEKLETYLLYKNANADELESSMNQFIEMFDDEVEFLGISYKDLVDIVIESISSIHEAHLI